MPDDTDLELSRPPHDASACVVEFHFSQSALAPYKFEALRSGAADPLGLRQRAECLTCASSSLIHQEETYGR
jgi:hypothetical protein